MLLRLVLSVRGVFQRIAPPCCLYKQHSGRRLKYAYTEGLKTLTFHCVLSYRNVDKNDMKTNAFKFENEFVSMCFSTPKR